MSFLDRGSRVLQYGDGESNEVGPGEYEIRDKMGQLQSFYFGSAPFDSWGARNTSQWMDTDKEVPTGKFYEYEKMKHRIPGVAVFSKQLRFKPGKDDGPGPASYVPKSNAIKFGYKITGYVVDPLQNKTIQPNRAVSKMLLIKAEDEERDRKNNYEALYGDVATLNKRCRAFGYTVKKNGEIVERGFGGTESLLGPAYYAIEVDPKFPHQKYSAKDSGVNWSRDKTKRDVFLGNTAGPGPSKYDPYHVHRELTDWKVEAYKKKRYALKLGNDSLINELNKFDKWGNLKPIKPATNGRLRAWCTYKNNDEPGNFPQQSIPRIEYFRDAVTEEQLPGPGLYETPRYLEEAYSKYKPKNKNLGFGSSDYSYSDGKKTDQTPGPADYDIVKPDKRFDDEADDPNLVKVSYQQTEAPFGFGSTRFMPFSGERDIAKTPGAGKYNIAVPSISTDLKENLIKKTGHLNTGFGTTARDKRINNAIVDLPEVSPAQYDTSKFLSIRVKNPKRKNGVLCSKSKRFEQYRDSETPAPGDYDINNAFLKTQNRKSFYQQSHKKARNPTGFMCSARRAEVFIPGEGPSSVAYEPRKVEKHIQVFRWPEDERFVDEVLEVPGPGRYDTPFPLKNTVLSHRSYNVSLHDPIRNYMRYVVLRDKSSAKGRVPDLKPNPPMNHVLKTAGVLRPPKKENTRSHLATKILPYRSTRLLKYYANYRLKDNVKK